MPVRSTTKPLCSTKIVVANILLLRVRQVSKAIRTVVLRKMKSYYGHLKKIQLHK